MVSNEDGFCSIRKTPINNTLSVRTKENNLVNAPDYFFALAKKSEPSSTKLSEFLSNHKFATHNGLNQKGCKTSFNQKLVLTTLDGVLRLWCLETGESIATLGDKFVTPFEDCAFSPKGKMIIGKLKTNEFLIYLTRSQSNVQPMNKKPFSEIETWF
jgi:WD40 repeat protein